MAKKQLPIVYSNLLKWVTTSWTYSIFRKEGEKERENNGVRRGKKGEKIMGRGGESARLPIYLVITIIYQYI